MLVRHRTYTPTRTYDRTPARTRPGDRPFDRAFEQLTNSFFDPARSNAPVVDGAWGDDEYLLTVDLPGVPAEAVTVQITGTTLALSAATDSLEWERSVRLSGRLDPEKVSAHHVDGRLTVRIGVVAEPEARSIAIDTSAPEAAIETTSTDTDQSMETNDTE